MSLATRQTVVFVFQRLGSCKVISERLWLKWTWQPTVEALEKIRVVLNESIKALSKLDQIVLQFVHVVHVQHLGQQLGGNSLVERAHDVVAVQTEKAIKLTNRLPQQIEVRLLNIRSLGQHPRKICK